VTGTITVRRHLRRRSGKTAKVAAALGIEMPGMTVAPYTRRRYGALPGNQNRIEARIEIRRKAFREGVGLGDKAGKRLTDEDIKKAEQSVAINFAEHAAYQDVQAYAHASGTINTDEASTIYRALGEIGSEKNGGWATGTDLATKIVVTRVIADLLDARIAARGGR